MAYYQGVVTDFLRANRAVFVNTECCIQVNPGENPDKTGPHWFCDAVAVDFDRAAIFLCEISHEFGECGTSERGFNESVLFAKIDSVNSGSGTHAERRVGES